MLSTPEFIPIPPERQANPDGDKLGSDKLGRDKLGRDKLEPRESPHLSKQAMAPRKLVGLFDESANPIYLLDSKDRIRFVNKSLLELLKVPIQDLIGLECGQRLPSDLHPHREICSLLSLPAAARDSVSCVPLPRNASKTVDQWSAVLVMPLSSASIAGTKAEKNIPDKSNFRLCIWVGEDSALGARLSYTPDWYDQTLIQSILHEQRKQQSNLGDFISLIGTSSVARLAMGQVQVAIAVDANCFLYGPIGSEHARIAKSIIEHRRRRQGRSLNTGFTLSIECRLMDRLLMSEMLEMATSKDENQVTLLLEGMDNLSVEAIEPLTLFLDRHPQVCVMATAEKRELPTQESFSLNRDLRSNLMATIGVLTVEIPALQDRIEDLPILAEQILEQLHHSTGLKQARSLSPTLRRWIQSYSWPGNYSELQRAISSAVATSKDTQLQPHDLPLAIRTFSSHDLKQDAQADLDLDQSLENYERIILKRALAAHQNNRAAAARSLGISRSRFLRRLEQLSIDSPFLVEEISKAQSTNIEPMAIATGLDATTVGPIAPGASAHGSGKTAIPDTRADSTGNTNSRSAPHSERQTESRDDPDLPIFESID